MKEFCVAVVCLSLGVFLLQRSDISQSQKTFFRASKQGMRTDERVEIHMKSTALNSGWVAIKTSTWFVLCRFFHSIILGPPVVLCFNAIVDTCLMRASAFHGNKQLFIAWTLTSLLSISCQITELGQHQTKSSCNALDHWSSRLVRDKFRWPCFVTFATSRILHHKHCFCPVILPTDIFLGSRWSLTIFCVAIAEWERNYQDDFRNLEWSLEINGSMYPLAKDEYLTTAVDQVQKFTSIKYSIASLNQMVFPEMKPDNACHLHTSNRSADSPQKVRHSIWMPAGPLFHSPSSLMTMLWSRISMSPQLTSCARKKQKLENHGITLEWRRVSSLR